jgi:hypothetical protein
MKNNQSLSFELDAPGKINQLSEEKGSTIEFKTSFGQEVIISLNAFANSDGGTILTDYRCYA